jgi:hypothetical protein
MQPAVETRTGFFHDEAFKRDVGASYGRYVTSFESDHHQVHAHLFEREGYLVAYVSFAPGYDRGRAKDVYASRLSEYAREHGYAEKLQLIHT